MKQGEKRSLTLLVTVVGYICRCCFDCCYLHPAVARYLISASLRRSFNFTSGKFVISSFKGEGILLSSFYLKQLSVGPRELG